MALTTLPRVKEYLRISTDSSKDSLITNLIDRVSARIESYCERTFGKTNYVELYDGDGSNMIRLNQRPVITLTEVRYDLQRLFPDSTVITASDLILYTKEGIIFWTNGYFTTSFYTGNFTQTAYFTRNAKQVIKVTYTAGYDLPGSSLYETSTNKLPFDVEDAVIKLVTAYMEKSSVGLVHERIGNVAYTYDKSIGDIPPDIASILNHYRKVVLLAV